MTLRADGPAPAPEPPQRSSRPPIRWARIGAITLLLLPLLLWAIAIASYALSVSLEFAGIPYNGAFQILNPMRRLAAGQVPGVDFQFFHGIGVPLLHYPVFALLGSTPYASEFARATVTPLLALVSTAAVAHVIGRNARERALALLLAFSAYTIMGLDAVLLPGNALEGTRSTMPFVAFAVLYSRLGDRPKAVLTALAMALAFALGTEHGVSLLMGFGATAALVVLFSPADRGRTLRFAAATLGAFVVALAVVFVAIGRGPAGAIGALRFNLIEVPADQMWYFGVPPNFYPETWAALLLNGPLYLGVTLVLLTIGGLLFGLRGRSSLALSAPAGALLVLLAYGLASNTPLLGRIAGTYYQPMGRALALAAVAGAFWYVRAHGGWAAVQQRLALPRWVVALGGVGACLATFYGLLWISARADTAHNLVKAAQSVARGGPHLNDHWQRYTEAVTPALTAATRAAAPGQAPFWSTYAGLAPYSIGLLQAGDDFIIHALGQNRRPHYVESFRTANPLLVETMRRAWFQYEDWLQYEHWDFYEELLLNYQVKLVTQHSIWWERNPGPWRTPDAACEPVTLDPDGRGAVVPERFLSPGEAVTVVTAQVDYAVQNPWRPVPVIGNLPRFLIEPDGTFNTGPVSLPPYATRWRFPILLERPAPGAVIPPVHLDFQTSSLLPGAAYRVTSLCLRTFPQPASAAAFLEAAKGKLEVK